MDAIQPISMPKWGLTMEEGTLVRWAVDVGATIAVGQEIMDIETTKIANVYESTVTGVLRRHVVGNGDTVPVGALLGVVSEPDVPEAAIDDFVDQFLAKSAVIETHSESSIAPTTIEAGGRRFRRLVAGPDSGLPILFLHGFGADLSTWTLNQAALAEVYQTHAIDLPGHGGSGKELPDGSVDALAAAVLAYMDAESLDAAYLVGHSLGGAIAATIALNVPSRVTGLTLVAPAGFGAEIAGDFIEGFISESRARKLRPYLEMLVANPRRVTADMVEDVLKFKRLDGATAALRVIATANFSGNTQRVDLRGRLADIRSPLRIICGENDRIIPANHAQGLPASIQVTTMGDAGHIVHMEKAPEVNELIARHASEANP